jgi:hypothetical protein
MNLKKQILTLALTVITFASFSQSRKDSVVKENLIIPTKEGVIFYEQVEECTDGQKDLYLKARKWFVDTFKNANSVLQMDDKEDGKLAGKAYHTYKFYNGMSSSNVDIDFTLNIDIKDGKYRVQFYDIFGSNTNVNNGLAVLGTLGGNYRATQYATTRREVEYNKVLNDYLAGKRVKYIKKLLDGMNDQVKILFASLEKTMKKPTSEDF